jgi:hypothetical protein
VEEQSLFVAEVFMCRLAHAHVINRLIFWVEFRKACLCTDDNIETVHIPELMSAGGREKRDIRLRKSVFLGLDCNR